MKSSSARLASRREGTTPSALKETTGASKQPGHLSRHEPHEKKLAAVHQGKQEWQATREVDAEVRDPAASEPGQVFTGRETSEYTTAHERVFVALAESQREHGGEGVYLDEVARASGLDRDQARLLLHDLTTVHRLVTELHGTDQPDLGPRYEAKLRR